jgi:hypothetical protein
MARAERVSDWERDGVPPKWITVLDGDGGETGYVPDGLAPQTVEPNGEIDYTFRRVILLNFGQDEPGLPPKMVMIEKGTQGTSYPRAGMGVQAHRKAAMLLYVKKSDLFLSVMYCR